MDVYKKQNFCGSKCFLKVLRKLDLHWQSVLTERSDEVAVNREIIINIFKYYPMHEE